MKRKRHIIFFVSLLLLLTFSFFMYSAAQQGITFSPPSFQKVVGKGNTTINLSDGLDNYYRAQIAAPKGYLITTQSMLERYDSQGGMAPPRVILMKGYQVTDPETYYKEVTNNPENECIAIWTTNGFSSIDDWSALAGYRGEVKGKTEIPVGERTAGMQTRIMGEHTLYEAYLRVSTRNGGVTYYFNTCNDQNKADFITVIQSLKLRADLEM